MKSRIANLPKFGWFLLGSVFAAGDLVALAATPPGTVDFNREIRPLFSQHCTACHGGVKAAGKISFVYRDKALAEGKSGEHAIVPGNPDASELMRRITSNDPDEIMPRPDHGPPLKPEAIATLKRWIQEGAAWSEHWSFVPPANPPLPPVSHNRWPQVPLDYFILARLDAENLKPAAAAPAAAWLRRVSLDLTGLPPSASDYAAFTKAHARNPSVAAAQAVDALMASPRFGERWASIWLDLARYSDTYGFEKDPYREIWPWRDWVISALNADMPFDAFTIRQLAGDLLNSQDPDDLLATAFHRNTQNNTEGGTDDEEYRTTAVLDRVNTTWTAWQATTFGCAQCHSHPYDPFPQQDYYRFAAFFNNSEDCDQNDDYPRYSFPRDSEHRAEAFRLQRASKQILGELNDSARSLALQVSDWTASIPSTATTTGGELQVMPDGTLQAGGTLPIQVSYIVEIPAPRGLSAIRLDILPLASDSRGIPERGQTFSKITAALVSPGASNQPVLFKEIIVDYFTGPHDPLAVINAKGTGTTSGFGSYPVLSEPRFAILVLAEPLRLPAGAILQLKFDHGIASNSGFQGCQLRRFKLSLSADTRFTALINDTARVRSWAAWQAGRDRLKELAGPNVPVMLERVSSAKRATRVFVRGNRLSPDEMVEPGVPEVVRPPRADGPMTRLDMARWLVSEQNPLAARVIANRLWAELFGRGIVETLEDFGTSGAKPSHPELLDHLAVRLRGELQWSIKRFLRELALSAAYAQDARAVATLIERDPANRLYARGPRTRLSAEMVRDQALAWSGLLSRQSFGPPVYPPQPDGVWSTVYSGETWKTSAGADRYRRGLYTYSRRTSGYPMFLTFDAPMRDTCTARRIPSNTPLQALTTLNDPAFIEMAQALAGQMESAGDSPRRMIEHGCRLITLSKPPALMLKQLAALYENALADYSTDSMAAKALAATPRRAALTLVANIMLNLDAAMVR